MNMTLFFTLFELMVLFSFTWRIHRFFQKYRSPLAKYLRNMALLGGIGMSVYVFMDFFILMNIYPDSNHFVFSIFQAVGGSIILFSFVYGLAAFSCVTSFSIPPKKVLFGGFILLTSSLIIRFIFFPLPFPWIDKSGNLRFKIPAFAGIISFLFSIIGLLPLALACTQEALKKKELRIRSGSFALALLFMIISLPLATMELFSGLYKFSSILRTTGFVMLAIAAIFRIEAETSSLQ